MARIRFSITPNLTPIPGEVSRIDGGPIGPHITLRVVHSPKISSVHRFKAVSANKLKRALVAQRAKASAADSVYLDRLIEITDRQILNRRISRTVMDHVGGALRNLGLLA